MDGCIMSMTPEETVSPNTMSPTPLPLELSTYQNNLPKIITNLAFVSSGDFGNSSQPIQLALVTSNLTGETSQKGARVSPTPQEKGTTTQKIQIQKSDKKRKHQVS